MRIRAGGTPLKNTKRDKAKTTHTTVSFFFFFFFFFFISAFFNHFWENGQHLSSICGNSNGGAPEEVLHEKNQQKQPCGRLYTKILKSI